MGESEYYSKVSESIKLIFDLTSRIDERVKILVEQHNETQGRIEKIHERHEGIMTRIVVLESKAGTELRIVVKELKEKIDGMTQTQVLLEARIRDGEIKVAALDIHNTAHLTKWKMVGDYVFKLIMMGLGAFITWKLSTK